MDRRDISGIGRRSFLKWSAGAAALAGLAMPRSARAAGDRALGTLIDLSLCDGCANLPMPACVASCRAINKDRVPRISEPIPVPWPRKIVEDWSKKQDVFHRLTPYNYLYIQRADVDWNGQKKTLYIPRRCMHCDNPACATICPFSANHKFTNGAVVIDRDLCFGGAKCRTVCPWEIPQRQSGVGIYLYALPTLAGNGVMFKCDLCHERLDRGMMPGCIEACPRNAMLIGPKRDMDALAQQRAKQMGGDIYGKTENGGTSTFYVSPVPFALMNRTMKRQPGQPDMPIQVERRMAGTDPMGKMVLASPVAGIAAGAAGAFTWLSRRKRRLQGEGKGNDRENP
jgi:Fe-S-cluster-containing dehydrogenase component